jgi:hypothetical protein
LARPLAARARGRCLENPTAPLGTAPNCTLSRSRGRGAARTSLASTASPPSLSFLTFRSLKIGSQETKKFSAPNFVQLCPTFVAIQLKIEIFSSSGQN